MCTLAAHRGLFPGRDSHYKWECEAEHGPQVKKPAVPDPNGVGPAPIKP